MAGNVSVEGVMARGVPVAAANLGRRSCVRKRINRGNWLKKEISEKEAFGDGKTIRRQAICTVAVLLVAALDARPGRQSSIFVWLSLLLCSSYLMIMCCLMATMLSGVYSAVGIYRDERVIESGCLCSSNETVAISGVAL